MVKYCINIHTMKVMNMDELKKYTKDELVKIALHNQLYNNGYYMSKKELRIALYTCHLAGIVLFIPLNSCSPLF
jgi:hypothetical protein